MSTKLADAKSNFDQSDLEVAYKGREPASVCFDRPVLVGNREFKTFAANVERGWKTKIDFEHAIVWIYTTNNQGRRAAGFTPFSNVVGCNFGWESDPIAVLAAEEASRKAEDARKAAEIADAEAALARAQASA